MNSAHLLLHPTYSVGHALRKLVIAMGVLAFPVFVAANPSAADIAPHLKMDLGMALSSDDCEDDYAELFTAAAFAPAASKTGQGASASNDIVLAKLSGLDAVSAPFAGKPAAQVAPTKPPAPQASSTPALAPVPQPVAIAPATPVVVPVAAVAVPVQAAAWEITPGDKTLNSALARWAQSAGWQLIWELPVDYSVDARTTIRGSFEEAVGMVARSMDSAEIPMKAIFYEGNRVLRIVARGAQ